MRISRATMEQAIAALTHRIAEDTRMLEQHPDLETVVAHKQSRENARDELLSYLGRP